MDTVSFSGTKYLVTNATRVVLFEENRARGVCKVRYGLNAALLLC